MEATVSPQRMMKVACKDFPSAYPQPLIKPKAYQRQICRNLYPTFVDATSTAHIQRITENTSYWAK
jgi:hypothetical protein